MKFLQLTPIAVLKHFGHLKTDRIVRQIYRFLGNLPVYFRMILNILSTVGLENNKGPCQARQRT